MKTILKCLPVLMLASLPAFSGAITIGNWYADAWGSSSIGSVVTDGAAFTGSDGTSLLDPGGTPFTFTGPATLFVTDLFVDGDRFSVFDNLTLVGSTSVPTNDGTNCGSFVTTTCANSKWSSGSFVFGAGSHSITMTLLAAASNTSSGTGAFELTSGTSAAPEPATLALMGLGVLGMFAARKRIGRA